MDNSSTQKDQSFIRRWWGLILLGAIAIVAFLTWGITMNHLANSAIIEPYSEIISAFSLQSPKARARLDAYYTKHQRQTVASKHYAKLCNELELLAAQDGILAHRESGQRVSACPGVVSRDEDP